MALLASYSSRESKLLMLEKIAECIHGKSSTLFRQCRNSCPCLIIAATWVNYLGLDNTMKAVNAQVLALRDQRS